LSNKKKGTINAIKPPILSEKDDSGGISRRRFLKQVGVAVMGAAVVGAGIKLFEHDNANAADENTNNKEPRRRHWSMVIDLRYCDGCQSIGKPPQCTTACIEGHFVPEGQQWIEVFEYDLNGGGTQFVPAPCMQCQNAPCVNVCPVGATWISPEGVVLIDQDRCIGCRMCMAACPYQRRFFNWGDPPKPPGAVFLDYNVETQVPARKGTVMKCDFCPDMARAGRLPFCVQACPNKAIYYGDLEEDIATNGLSVVKLSLFLPNNHAYRLKEELNTKPRTYFIAGHGEMVGRNHLETGRLPVEWKWIEKAKEAGL
jgi:molybdopterin-containing oxidoreductase family iron-sulfur binding subunit